MSEPLKSRSVLRREAVQKGEPMPTFEAQPRLPLTPAERAALRQTCEAALPNTVFILADRLLALLDEVERLDHGLREIVEHPHCAYYSGAGGSYGIGVADGHRCAATHARKVLNREC